MTEKKEQCKKYNVTITSSKSELEKIRVDYNNLRQKRFAAENLVANKVRLVESLRKQLIEAEKDLTNSQIDLVNIKEEEQKLPSIIADL